MILFNIACTVSNVERTHKVTSLIHTCQRSLLSPIMVDSLTRGNLAYRLIHDVKSVSKRPGIVPSDLTTFSTLSDEDESALASWAEVCAAADWQTAATIANPVADESPCLFGASGDAASPIFVAWLPLERTQAATATTLLTSYFQSKVNDGTAASTLQSKLSSFRGQLLARRIHRREVKSRSLSEGIQNRQ